MPVPADCGDPYRRAYTYLSRRNDAKLTAPRLVACVLNQYVLAMNSEKQQ
jgi:hypothetical protein